MGKIHAQGTLVHKLSCVARSFIQKDYGDSAFDSLCLERLAWRAREDKGSVLAFHPSYKCSRKCATDTRPRRTLSRYGIANAKKTIDTDVMATPRSILDVISAIAQQKVAAAKARQHPNSSAEKPREAILAGLQLVAEAIADDGYVFSPALPRFVRKDGDLTFEIRIQSDRNNAAGQRAAIWVHTAIYSRSLSAWRKSHGNDWIRPNAPFPLPIFGAQIGNLCHPAGWMEWDFADVTQRQLVADDAISTIRRIAYPLFSTFDGAVEDIAALVDRDWPAPERVLSYLLSKGHAVLAEKALRRYLAERPKFQAEFEELRQKFANEGLPSFRAAIPHDLAAFAVATGFPWSALPEFEE